MLRGSPCLHHGDGNCNIITNFACFKVDSAVFYQPVTSVLLLLVYLAERDSTAACDDGLTLGTWRWSCGMPGFAKSHVGAGIAATAGGGRGSWWISALTLSVSGVAGCKVGSSGVDYVTGTCGSVVASVGVLRTARRSSSV